MGIKRTALSRQMDLWLQNKQFLLILKHKMQKTKSTHFPLYFWANPFVKLIVKLTKEKGVLEENVFSNICSTHKNAPKQYSPILKCGKRKNWYALVVVVVGVPSDYFVSTQLRLWLFCCWGCGCCWAVTIVPLVAPADNLSIGVFLKGQEGPWPPLAGWKVG